MHTKNALPPVLGLLLAGFVITARTEGQKAEPHVQVKEAAVSKLEPGVPLDFSVTGLTKENLEKVQKNLTALTVQVFACEGCKREEAVAGKCAQCNLDLKEKKELVLLEVLPSVEGASIRLTPAAARTLRYSDLEGALKKDSIQIDAAKFPLAGKSRLVLRGGKLENTKTVEKALMDSKLFELVKATYDAPSGEIRVMVHAKTTPPMRSDVAAVIDALGTKAKLSDVIWGPLPTPAKV